MQKKFEINKKFWKNKNSSLLKFSFIENKIKNKSSMERREFDKYKNNSLKLSLFIGLFVWLCVGIVIQNILFSLAISIVVILFLFVFLIQLPLMKKKKHSRKVEAELPFFILKIVMEIKVGKDFFRALKDASKEKGFAAEEFAIVVNDIEKGSSLKEALAKMNDRIDSLNIKRITSNLANIYLHGGKTLGLKKLAQELLLKQKIESKEFGGKMVVYSLVFIAVSAIVPAMFASFVLIGSYFMKLSFSPIEVFLIIVLLFPMLDAFVLILINSKTPLFLKN